MSGEGGKPFNNGQKRRRRRAMVTKKKSMYARAVKWARANYGLLIFYTITTILCLCLIGTAILQVQVNREIELLQDLYNRPTTTVQYRTEWRTIGDLQTLLNDLNKQLEECHNGITVIKTQSVVIANRLSKLDAALNDFNSKMAIINERAPE